MTSDIVPVPYDQKSSLDNLRKIFSFFPIKGVLRLGEQAQFPRDQSTYTANHLNNLGSLFVCHVHSSY